jgi:hypothetical protein
MVYWNAVLSSKICTSPLHGKTLQFMSCIPIVRRTKLEWPDCLQRARQISVGHEARVAKWSPGLEPMWHGALLQSATLTRRF